MIFRDWISELLSISILSMRVKKDEFKIKIKIEILKNRVF